MTKALEAMLLTRQRAGALRAHFAGTDPVTRICEIVEAL
jgi:hypothetical protein